MNRRLERKSRKSWKRRKPGDHWDLLGYRTPGHEVEAGVLVLVGRASKTPGRVTCCKGARDGSYCSLRDEDTLQGEGAQSFHDVVAAAAAGGDGDVWGLVGGLWTDPQEEGKGLDGWWCWPRGGHREEEAVAPGSTQPGMGERAGYT